MARLKIARPRLAPGRARGNMGGAEGRRVYDRQRERANPWRAWYRTKQWKALRREILDRDLWTCQQTRVMLSGKHPAPNSPVVDHILPHRGNPELFWDRANLQAVSKVWHDSIKQAEEKSGRKVASTHPEWLRPSLVPLTIVCGPPASGKSGLVRARAGVGELVIDLDEIAARLSAQGLRRWSRDKWLGPALRVRNNLLGQLSRDPGWPAAWLIVSEPSSIKRDWWQAKLEPVEMLVLAVASEECRRRAKIDGDRDQAVTSQAIADWWRRYTPRPGETTLKT
ncbi:HNH nuclease [Pukyongiella litopenaei]|uniref:HNH nuclease n=1 Tax=Pukyongiella litopenaei TaxID=2605946 RepID=UPI001B80B27F|nr:HNH nuclease [Pukyongiella litopenaei]